MKNPRELDTAEIELPPLDAPLNDSSPSTVRVDFDFGAVTHPGNVRPKNEDHYLVFRLGRSMNALSTNLTEDDIPKQFEEFAYSLVVADGMGGMAAGELASKLVLKAGVQRMLNDVKWDLKVNEDTAAEIMDKMVQYCRALDFLLTEKARSDRNLSGMGTTLSVAYTIGIDLFIVHIGDSRIYLFRDGRLEQLTSDHTVAQSLADAGTIASEDVAQHRQKHVLTNALGGNAGMIKADVLRKQLKNGDHLLLCTDGLTDLVSDSEIVDLLNRFPNCQEACEHLLGRALEMGGRDNITVLIAAYSFSEGKDTNV